MNSSNRIRTSIPGLAVLAAGLSLSTTALAHTSWLEPEILHAAPEASIPVSIGWGHAPGEDTLSPQRMLGVAMYAPDGSAASLALTEDSEAFLATPEMPGLHILAGQQLRGYWSRTVEGGRQGSKRAYPDASQCSYANNSAKALVRVGDSDAGFERALEPLGQPLEIVPAANPLTLSTGERLVVHVYRHEQPAAAVEIAAYRFGGPTDEEPMRFKTDSQGSAEVPFEVEAGVQWLLLASSSVPFHDDSLCDRHSLNAALTFAFSE